MKKPCLLLSFILINFVFQCSALAATEPANIKPNQTTPTFPQDQTEKIEKIVHDYLVNNPQVLIEVGKKLQDQEIAKEKATIAKINTNIPTYKKQLFDAQAPGRVVLGNPKGKIIIAEFTQHQCPHCKVAKPIIDKLIKNNPEIQLIIIYWPFFGKDAIYTAKAVLAAQKQNKFSELDQAFLSSDSFVTQEKADAIIKSISTIDQKKLYADINSKELDAGINANAKLAEDLTLIGTPSFIFTNREMTKFSLIPGQTPAFKEDLSRALTGVR